MTRILANFVLLGALSVSALGCSSETPSSTAPDFDSTVLAMSDEAILPAAERFENSVASLEDAIESLCVAPDETGVEAARQRWRDASLAWNRFAMYDFGPMSDGIPTPADAFIDSFKAFRQGESHVDTVRAQLNDFVMTGADLSNESFESYTYQRVGFVALEVALFETATEPPDTSAAAVATELTAGATKCDYLTGQAALLTQRASALHAAWRADGDDYRDTFLSSTNDALGAVLSSIHGHLEYLERRSIANRGAPISGASYDNIGATVDEVEALLAAGGSDSLGARLGEAQAQSVLDDHAARVAAIRAALASEDPDALGPELVALANIHKTDIPQALGITLGLNFTDGD